MSSEKNFGRALKQRYNSFFKFMERKEVYEYDAFISHAVEDKIPIANELCARLEGAGFRIWYSGQELRVGNRLAPTIESGLEKSRFGIVVLSPTYVKSKWALREFYSLLAKEKTRGTVILPVLYDITPEELALEDLVMAETFAVPASRGMDYVVRKLTESMTTLHAGSEREASSRRKRNSILLTTAGLLILAVIAAVFLFNSRKDAIPGDATVRRIIESRIQTLTRAAEQDKKMAGLKMPAELDEVIKQYVTFKDIKSYYRNEYHLITGVRQIDHKKNVEAALHLDIDTVSPLNAYTFSLPHILKKEIDEMTTEYFLSDQSPISYEYSLSPVEGTDDYSLNITYKNNIRNAHLILTFPLKGTGKKDQARKHHRLTLYALPPAEVISLSQSGDDWEWKLSSH